MYFERLPGSLTAVRERIRQACERSGRSDADAITIVAVTKGHPIEAVYAARQVGLDVIGESRVQEAQAKWTVARDVGLTWHLVGHLQRNKVRQALQMFSLLQSLDSLRLAETIERKAAKAGQTLPVLVQVNASREQSKQGFAVDEALAAIRRICELEHLRVEGLMTMAPFTDDRDVLRQTFRLTRALFERCRDGLKNFEARHLSMGMTNDFEIAIEEGSTMVRLGTVLFGERPR